MINTFQSNGQYRIGVAYFQSLKEIFVDYFSDKI